MPQGLGTGPMGLFPLGFGVGDPAPAPPTGNWGSRYINPSTGDYEQDPATGQLKQMPGVRQRFLIRLKTKRGSSSVQPTLGVDLPKKIDASYVRRIDNAVRVAMRQETDVEKVARITAVIPTRDPGNAGRVNVTVQFIDLTTGLPDQVTI